MKVKFPPINYAGHIPGRHPGKSFPTFTCNLFWILITLLMCPFSFPVLQHEQLFTSVFWNNLCLLRYLWQLEDKFPWYFGIQGYYYNCSTRYQTTTCYSESVFPSPLFNDRKVQLEAAATAFLCTWFCAHIPFLNSLYFLKWHMKKQYSCREVRGKEGLFQCQKTAMHSSQHFWLKAYRHFQENNSLMGHF